MTSMDSTLSSWVKVQGTSMWPFLRPGDRVEVEWFNGQMTHQPRVGDLVFLQGDERQWIVHRITDLRVEVGGTQDLDERLLVEVKGDASLLRELVPVERIWGRVCRIQRGAEGTISSLLRNRLWDRWIAQMSQNCPQGTGFLSRMGRRIIFTGVGILGTFRRIFL